MGLAEIELKTATYYNIVEKNSGTKTVSRTTDTNEEVTASNSFKTTPYYVPMQKGDTKFYYAIVKTGTASTKFDSVTGADQWSAEYEATGIAKANIDHYDAYSTRVGTSTYSGLFNYSGYGLAFTVPFTGTYTIECWGAQGADASTSSYKGGKGGYVRGDITLSEGMKLYVYVGEAGKDYSSAMSFNGGGRGSYWPNDGQSYRGGGATDVRTVVHSASDGYGGDASLNSRFIVAAGGGGALTYGSGGDGTGGAAGGRTGYSGATRNKGTTSGWINATGGTQNGGGSGWKWGSSLSHSTNGSKGYGGINTENNYGSGGGSGYYGGGSGGYVSGVVSSGAGGSSFISGHPGCTSVSGYVFTEGTTEMIDGQGKSWTTSTQTTGGSSKTMPTPPGGSISLGNQGNGYCRVTGSSSAP